MGEIERAHERAVLAAMSLKRSEKQVLEALIEVEDNRVWEKKGYPSLHVYCVEALRLTDAQAYFFTGVARKSKEVPELRELVSSGSIHITNARRIVPVLTQENKTELLTKARELSYRALERELIKTHPEKVTKERIRPVTETRLEMKVFISPEIEKNLKRMQDVLSQKLKKPCSMEGVLEFMASECLKRHDPIKKAQRSKPALVARQTSPQGRAIPAAVTHEVVKRDHGQCTFILPSGKRCPSMRWVDRHHITPWARGGGHSAENLTTLCAAHHRFIHDSGSARAKRNVFRAGTMAR